MSKPIEPPVSKKHEIKNAHYIWPVFYFAGAWVCSIWGPFQLFTATRQFFGEYTSFDFSLLAICIFGALFTVWRLRNHPVITTLCGFMGMALISYISIFTVPITQYASTTQILTWGFITTEDGAINYNLIVYFAGIIMGSATQIWMYESLERPINGKLRHIWTLEMCMGMALSLALYLILLYIVPNDSNGMFAGIAISASAILILLGIEMRNYMREWHFPDLKKFNRMKTLESATNIYRTFSFILTWAISGLFIIIPIFIYYTFLQTPLTSDKITFIIANLMAGAGILLVLYLNEPVGRLLRYAYVFASGIILGLVYLIAINVTPYSAFNIGLGVICCLVSFYYLRELANYSRAKTGGVWLVVLWLVAGYISGIPATASSILSVQQYVPWILIGMVGVEIIAQVIRFCFVPSVFQVREYMKFKETLDAEKEEKQ